MTLPPKVMAEVERILNDTFGEEGCYCCGTKSFDDDVKEAKTEIATLLTNYGIDQRIAEAECIPIHKDANGVVDQLMPIYQANRIAHLQTKKEGGV